MPQSACPPRWLFCLALILCACYAPSVARQRSYHASDADLTVTRIVHAAVILDFRGTRVLVDPWYSPNPPLGPRETIGIALDKLPPMRGILITHQHDDHFDVETLENYPDKSVRVVVPKGLGERIRAMGYEDVVEVEDWEQTQIGNVILMAVPASHSVRENGYVLQGDSVTVYVAGDTLFDAKSFAAIAEIFPSIDVALLPVGGYRMLGRQLDMTPEQAARAFTILKPHHAIPYHYGLTGPFPFVLSRAEAPQALIQAIEKRAPGSGSSVVVLETGESWHHYR